MPVDPFPLWSLPPTPKKRGANDPFPPQKQGTNDPFPFQPRPFTWRQKLLVGLFVLCVAGLIGFGWLGQLSSAHIGRFIGTLAPALAGIGIGLSAMRNKRRIAGFSWMLGGLGLASVAWWFVPTNDGLSYWAAQQRVTALRERQAKYIKGYRSFQAELEGVLRQFPSFEAEGETIKQIWIEQVVEAAVARTEPLLASDPARASTELEALNRELQVILQRRGAPPPPSTERHRNADSVRDSVESPQIPARSPDGTGPNRNLQGEVASSPVGKRLLEARRRAVQSYLGAVKKECEGLAVKERFQEATDVVNRLHTTRGHEIGAVGLVGEWYQLQEFVEKAEQDWLDRHVGAAVARAGTLLATDPGRASTELQQLDRSLQKGRWYATVKGRLLKARQDALQAQLVAGKRECKAMVAQERYQEAAAAAERLSAMLESEARAVGMEKDLAFREGYGFLADLARQAGKAAPK